MVGGRKREFNFFPVGLGATSATPAVETLARAPNLLYRQALAVKCYTLLGSLWGKSSA